MIPDIPTWVAAIGYVFLGSFALVGVLAAIAPWGYQTRDGWHAGKGEDEL